MKTLLQLIRLSEYWSDGHGRGFTLVTRDGIKPERHISVNLTLSSFGRTYHYDDADGRNFYNKKLGTFFKKLEAIGVTADSKDWHFHPADTRSLEIELKSMADVSQETVENDIEKTDK